MSSENTIDNEGWATIVKKSRRITNPENKPTKYIYKWSDNITKKDTTLTSKEQELIKQEMLADPKLNIFCQCCQSGTISDVIRRSFFSCGKCFCCAGDNPAFDDDEWCENCIVSVGIFYKYNNDYHFTKDQDFYTN
jgi:hypothetical protein